MVPLCLKFGAIPTITFSMTPTMQFRLFGIRAHGYSGLGGSVHTGGEIGRYVKDIPIVCLY